MKKNFWDHTTGKLNTVAIVQAASDAWVVTRRRAKSGVKGSRLQLHVPARNRVKALDTRFYNLVHAFDVLQIHQRDPVFAGDQRDESRVSAIQVVERS